MTKIENSSGFKPIFLPATCKVLVYVDSLQEKKTEGGIVISSAISEKECYARPAGVVVEAVFKKESDLKEFASQVKIGDVVSFRPYAGRHKKGDDGNGYRLLDGDEIQDLYVQQGNEYKNLDNLYLSVHENNNHLNK